MWKWGPMEQRKYRRTTIQTEIWIGQDGIFTRTPETLRDLSEGGAFVETSQRFAVGSVLNLRFKLPGTHRLIGSTVAVRNLRGNSGLGVEFLDISPCDREEIRWFVSAKPRETVAFL